jgi:hypothetical protein
LAAFSEYNYVNHTFIWEHQKEGYSH